MKEWKALLVDDEEDFVSTLAERLRLRGIEAQTAANGEEALQSIDTDPPQVVLLDLLMPGLGGLEVLRRIVRKHPQIKVILLTGRGSTREGIEGIRLGASDFLMKPVKIEELIQKMSEALQATGPGTTEERGQK